MVRTKRFALLPLFAALLVAGVLPLLAHGAAAQDATATAAPGGEFPVKARFINAMTTVGKIDVDLNDDDNRIVQDLEYGKVSDEVELTAPVSNIIVKEPRNNQFDLWLFNTIVSTQAGSSYVITVSDLFIIPVQVDTSPLGDQKARGRLVHAAAEAPPVDVLLNDKPTRITNLRYGLASDTGEVPAGTYDVKLNQTGTSTTVLDVPSTALDAGQSYVMVLIGKPGSSEQPLATINVATPVQAS
ncbi:MAG TPA: DUF4397 domain-containing protein [Thermomicrobiales bacterium]|jgi:hypothetical protein